jgi:hypothetical protein
MRRLPACRRRNLLLFFYRSKGYPFSSKKPATTLHSAHLPLQPPEQIIFTGQSAWNGASGKDLRRKGSQPGQGPSWGLHGATVVDRF